MTWARRPHLTRTLLATALTSLALLLGGCVYLRLLELKRQFEHFDRNFTLQTSDGLRITCLNPVLLTSDVRWMGLKPETVKKLGLAEQWQVRWVKQVPAGVTEATPFDIVVELSFANDTLNRVAIPERYFALMPKSFLIGVLKSLGRASIDSSGRKVEADVSPEEMRAARLSLPGIDKLLGRPSEERTEGTQSVLRYLYVPATKESQAGVFDMTLYFDSVTGELLHWQGRTPIGKIGFNFAPPRPAPAPARP